MILKTTTTATTTTTNKQANKQTFQNKSRTKKTFHKLNKELYHNQMKKIARCQTKLNVQILLQLSIYLLINTISSLDCCISLQHHKDDSNGRIICSCLQSSCSFRGMLTTTVLLSHTKQWIKQN